MTNQYIVKKIELQYVNQPEKRRIKVWLRDTRLKRTTYVYISRSYEGYEIYNANVDEAWAATPVAQQYNSWLHEGIEEPNEW